MIKIVDNFELLANKLFENPLENGEFYFVQILIRGKDGHNVNGNNKNRLIRYYVVREKEKLLELRPEIVMLCRFHNARAYIHTTPREDKAVAAEMLKDAVNEFTVGNYHVFRRLFSTACGRSYSTTKKTFLVDLDGVYAEEPKRKYFENIIKNCRGKNGENKIIVEVPTKNGMHLICHPFDIGEFEMKARMHFFKEDIDFVPPDIHKNNPTLLYFEGV